MAERFDQEMLRDDPNLVERIEQCTHDNGIALRTFGCSCCSYEIHVSGTADDQVALVYALQGMEARLERDLRRIQNLRDIYAGQGYKGLVEALNDPNPH